MSNLDSLRYFLPEMILAAGVIIILLCDLITSRRRALPYLTLMVLLIAFILSISLMVNWSGPVQAVCSPSSMDIQPQPDSLFNSLMRLTGFTIFFKLFFLLATALTILFTISKSSRTGRDEIYRGVEYYSLLLISNIGLFLLSSANDLLTVYIGLETVSICSYLLVASHKGIRKSSEAGLKYVIYGAIASGIMLYGMAFLYGLCGSTSFDVIFRHIGASFSAVSLPAALAAQAGGPATGAATGYYQITLMVSLLMIFAGLGYKIAAVPFHMWCPDVYEGAPTEITAFLSVAPKAAGFAIIITFFIGLFQQMAGLAFATVPSLVFAGQWQLIFAVISVLTMTIGNFAALHQTNMKRLLAYSSIAHAGYMMMGLVVFNQQAILLYLSIYLIMNMGAFLVVYIIEKSTGRVDIKEYEGLGWSRPAGPLLAVTMAIFLFALVGIPPFSGFIAKVYVFSSVINEEWYLLAVIGVLNGVVSLYYYARIVGAMFLKVPADPLSRLGGTVGEPQPTPVTVSAFNTVLLLALAVPTIILGIYWSPLLQLVNWALALNT